MATNDMIAFIGMSPLNGLAPIAKFKVELSLGGLVKFVNDPVVPSTEI